MTRVSPRNSNGLSWRGEPSQALAFRSRSSSTLSPAFRGGPTRIRQSLWVLGPDTSSGRALSLRASLASTRRHSIDTLGEHESEEPVLGSGSAERAPCCGLVENPQLGSLMCEFVALGELTRILEWPARTSLGNPLILNFCGVASWRHTSCRFFADSRKPALGSFSLGDLDEARRKTINQYE